jgi:uncharacterized damage-inducible protein DinB
MNPKDVIRGDFDRSKMVTEMLLAELSDTDIMQRPAPGANHIAWQLGHLVSSTHHLGESVQAGSMPSLPEGFDEKHSKEAATSDDAAAFLKKDEYIALLNEQRDGIVKLLGEIDESRLDEDAPEAMRSYAPKIADLLGLTAAHEMMHSGQITVLRRKLGKPVAF